MIAEITPGAVHSVHKTAGFHSSKAFSNDDTNRGSSGACNEKMTQGLSSITTKPTEFLKVSISFSPSAQKRARVRTTAEVETLSKWGFEESRFGQVSKASRRTLGFRKAEQTLKGLLPKTLLWTSRGAIPASR